MRPQGNGLVEIRGEKTSVDRGFCCYQLGQFMIEEGWDMSRSEYNQFRQERMREAKAGQCAYRDRCPKYKETIKKENEL